MIIKFLGKLRIVVGSGNLCLGDWMFWANCFVKMDFKEKAPVKKSEIREPVEQILKEKSDYPNIIKMKNIEKKVFLKPLDMSSPNFSLKVNAYLRRLEEYGYSFKVYLKKYLQFTMESNYNELEEYLNIDLNKYNLEQKELFLIGSLPGGHPNLIHYNSPECLEMGRP
jgi:hypothetical protein